MNNISAAASNPELSHLYNRIESAADDMKDTIFSFLTFRDLIGYDNTQRLTVSESEWAYRRKADRYMFSWQACEREVGGNQKWNYCLTKALILFIEIFPACKRCAKTAHDICRKYEGLVKKFPTLGSYIERHLALPVSNITPPNIDSLRAEIVNAGMNGFGGESLLQGLCELEDYQNSKHISANSVAIEWLNRAIGQGATVAATLALAPVLGCQRMQLGIVLDLAIEALQRGDRKQFDELTDGMNYRKLFDFADEKLNKDCCFVADLLYTKAIAFCEDIGLSPPAVMLCNASTAKLKLGQKDEADELSTKALLAFGENVPAVALYNAGILKNKIGQDKEADQLFNSALLVFGDNVPDYALHGAAGIKRKLAQYAEADALYTRALTTYGNNPPDFLLANAAETKARLGQNLEADKLFTRGILAFGDNVPFDLLLDAAAVKHLLHQYFEAEVLYTRALELFGDNPPFNMVVMAANAKAWIGCYNEADELYTRALVAYGNNPPADVLASASTVKNIIELEANKTSPIAEHFVLEDYNEESIETIAAARCGSCNIL